MKMNTALMDDDDLYEHSFSDADFWSEWIGINVTA
jgi:hypothetical protein